MRRFLLCFLLPLWGCQSEDLTLPGGLDPAPFHAARELRLNTGTGVEMLELDMPVALLWETDEFALRRWTLQTPPGSGATLSDPTAPRPTFVPDLEGEYVVGLTTSMGGNVIDTVLKRFLAAAYLGRASCAVCHGERAVAAAATSHGTTLERRAAELFAVPGCLTCHVVGSNVNRPVSAAGGFDDEAARVGFDAQTYVFTDFATFATDFPTLADRGAVQCESCHGPGSLHMSDPRNTSISTDARLCGACHNTFGPRFKQWQLSVHAAAPPAGTIDNPSCVRCHTARGFARSVAGLVPREQGAGEPGVTCAACHDPHSAANLSEVRLFGDVTLGDGSTFDA
ncbi:MAG: multiheme c-type cytochrome, partial [Planctomycetota bacterium]